MTVAACVQRDQVSSLPVATTCATDADVRYFPVGVFIDTRLAGVDKLVRRWYSEQLAAMGEPSLSCGSADLETYRLVWLRTFHHPVAVRVFRTDTSFHLEAVILDGRGGYEPGRVLQRVSRDLTREQWKAIIAELRRAHFWQEATTTHDGGDEGAQWIIEARRQGRYHLIDRWGGANDAAAARSIGMKLLDTAGLTQAVGPVY
jgi:hypothetical protein